MQDEESESIIQLRADIKCPTCQGNQFYRGSNVCYLCQNGGTAIDGMAAGGKGTVKKVSANSAEVAALTGKGQLPAGNIPDLK